MKQRTVAEYQQYKKKEKIRFYGKYVILALIALFSLRFSNGIFSLMAEEAYKVMSAIVLCITFVIFLSKDSKKVKILNQIVLFEQEIDSIEVSSYLPFSHSGTYDNSFNENLIKTYAQSIINNWNQWQIDNAVQFFEKDGTILSLYSLAIYEEEIKNNWEKYKGQRIHTLGYTYSSLYNFIFVAYPLHQYLVDDVYSNQCVYSSYVKNKHIQINNKQLTVIQNNERLRIAANNITNKQIYSSFWKQVEYDPGTKVFLSGDLTIDDFGNLTLENCDFE